MGSLDDKGTEYIRLGKEIQELETKRKEIQKELVKSMPIGHRVVYDGVSYEWITYDRSAQASWKELYKNAYGFLPDDAQVIMGEAERRGNKVTALFKFEKR